MPLYNDLEVRPRYGSALPSYEPGGARLEPTDQMDMRAIALRAAAAGALGTGIGSAGVRSLEPYVSWKAADDALFSFDPDLEFLPEFPNKKELYNEAENLLGRSGIRGQYRAGLIPEDFTGGVFWERSAPYAGLDNVGDAAEAALRRSRGIGLDNVSDIRGKYGGLLSRASGNEVAEAVLSPEVDSVIRRMSDQDHGESMRVMGMEHGRVFSEEELARNRQLNVRAMKARDQKAGELVQDYLDLEGRAGTEGLTRERIREFYEPQTFKSSMVGTKAGRHLLGRLVRSAFSPAQIATELAVGGAVGAGSALGGYASGGGPQESAGLFTPPGPGYEGLVTPEDIIAVAEQKEEKREARRVALLQEAIDLEGVEAVRELARERGVLRHQLRAEDLAQLLGPVR